MVTQVNETISGGWYKDLATILKTLEKREAWRSGAYVNPVVLPSKPARGTMPIALMSTIYSVWRKVRRPYIVQW